MAKNEFLPFGIAEGANVLSNQEYERLAARFNGFVSGVAKSKELNTVWRQSSVMSSALAQFIVDSDNKDLLDNGDVASVKNRLVAAIKQTISGVGYVTTAAMNLELNKKFDKANISGVKGNDNDKVPSLNLFTTEVGKLQPKGDYQPAGDYATNTALTNGLNQKLDKAGGVLNGGLSAVGSVIAQGVIESYKSVAAVVPDGVGSMLDSTGDLPVIKSRESSVLGWKKHSLQNKDGTLAHISDLEKIFPIGASILWNTSTPIPDNFWANEGRSFSASEYPELAKVYPNLKLPDDRGYAIRIADNGRGIDQGRVIGTYQEDAMRDITGEVGDVQVRGESVTQSGALYYTGTGGKGNSSLGADSVIKIRFAASRQVPTANEFRMKNVAKILITRVK